MIRIGNNSLLSPEVALKAAAGAPPQGEIAADAHVADLVQLSHSINVVPQDRAHRIAELKTIVNSPDYVPSSLPVSRKLIGGAQSRAK